MDRDQAGGLMRRMGGAVQSAVGGAAGDTATQLRGRADQVAGQAQDAYGEVLDEVEHLVSDRPLLALLTGIGVGFLLGIIVARR